MLFTKPPKSPLSVSWSKIINSSIIVLQLSKQKDTEVQNTNLTEDILPLCLESDKSFEMFKYFGKKYNCLTKKYSTLRVTPPSELPPDLIEGVFVRFFTTLAEYWLRFLILHLFLCLYFLNFKFKIFIDSMQRVSGVPDMF